MKKYVEQIVVAEPNWCVPAALEMVLKHHGINSLTQWEIAGCLDIVPASDKVEHNKWGAKIKQNTLNDLFVRNAIPLREKYISISQFMDEFFMSQKLAELLLRNVSIICGYNYTSLFGCREDFFQHVSIVVDILPDFSGILLLDPGPKDAGYKVVKSDDLFYAIKAAKDGLWCIE